MRVISGKHRGAKLSAPKGLTTRPTDDMLKENIFNLIGPIKNQSSVLDIFAGSGQIGIEFLSRGSSKVVFIDKNFKAIESINANLEKIKRGDQKVFKTDALRYIKSYHGAAFDYVYIDPPYDDKKLLFDVLEFLNKSDIIGNNTKIIIETVEDLNESFENYFVLKSRKYGKRKVIILEVENEGSLSG
ncbi:16S rRNA (guanine(966)-N(2))-methyltransferase RsmD [uncultured Ezakiella sp.]|uniref:16S rRNA (guanine(966)-N(2))-methyltransferase RsmD n=1 Tax=uncultured Ezakiella sp. TaxID=1637529 RepID=UPI0025FF494F|nr:16S rRNA (guanine(966)-N(2))-methyltransferase RsmD [uncultured Ezakiella sp.]